MKTLVLAGYHTGSNGKLFSVDSNGYYWSSTVDDIYSRYLYFNGTNADMFSLYRAYAFSVRCLKD